MISSWTKLNLFIIALAVWIAGCSKDSDPAPVSPGNSQSASIASCIGCHTDYATLKRIASPDTSSGGGGCGGEGVHIEPYDRVFLGGTGFVEFRQSTHGQMACTTCHNGVDGTSDKRVAHSGEFIVHPSMQAVEKCGGCHSTASNHASTSIHANGWGQKSMVALRYGATSFDALPQPLKAGYDANCAGCHASCGSCHVNRPKAVGGGVLRGHKFMRVPDMRNNCIGCHSSRVGHGYFGIGVGTIPDVHSSRFGDGHCMNCHSPGEMHGDGQVYDQRYKVPQLPKCTDCHGTIQASNAYHAAHINTFSCQTCHSQNYNNCGSCHIGGAGARIPSYLGFKIGMNPIPQTRAFRYAVLRRSLMAPDSWQNYGASNLTNFAVRPTFKYATPHNIQRWTSRTRVASGQTCYDNCHIINENGTYRNKELYLFRSDLQSWEVTADTGIVVDGKLPQRWGTP